jgi:hypothetical protein
MGKMAKPQNGYRKEPLLVQWVRWVTGGCFKEHGSFSSQVGIGVMGKGSPSRELFFFRKDSGIM